MAMMKISASFPMGWMPLYACRLCMYVGMSVCINKYVY